MIKKLSIIIPVFNEANTIHVLLDKIRKVELINSIDKEIIIVNDASKDNSESKIEWYITAHTSMDIRYFKLKQNMGKGAALREGIQKASGDYLVIQDADLEYDPKDYNLLLEPVVNAHADIVYGSRFRGGTTRRSSFFWHAFGNKFLTRMSNAFTNLALTDMETCYKLMKTSIAKDLELKENRFGFEPEVTAKIARLKGVTITEVGISYQGRSYAEGKKIGWRDGIRAMYCIIKYNFF